MNENALNKLLESYAKAQQAQAEADFTPANPVYLDETEEIDSSRGPSMSGGAWLSSCCGCAFMIVIFLLIAFVLGASCTHTSNALMHDINLPR